MTSENMGSTSNTSIAFMKNDVRDRLSELPDDILVHILSFLPIVDAVRTVSIRRFGNLWTLVSSLDFKDTDFFRAKNWPNAERCFRFTNFLCNVLRLHKRNPIDKLLLRFCETNVCDIYDTLLITDLIHWMRLTMQRQVKELDVRLEYDVYNEVIPHCVFRNPFLVKLKLFRCQIQGPSRVQMGSLRKLSLNYVKVSNEMFKQVVFGCPSLQELVLHYAFDLDVVRFTAPNIENLHVESDHISVLDYPNLKILNVHLCCRTRSNLRVVNIPSVREVHIRSTNQFDKIVNNICKAEVVKFSEEAFRQSNLEELDIPQTRWKRLHIESRLNEDQLIGILRVLRSSTQLEELIVFSTSRRNMQRVSGKTHDHHLFFEELSSLRVIPQLKSVTLHGHKVLSQGLHRLAEFLLKSCVNLEKMVMVGVEEHKFVEQVCSFPRASANARVICESEVYK